MILLVYKPRQERKTFEDVVDFQNHLLEIIMEKEKKKKPLTEKEASEVRFLYPRSVLSHGSSKFLFKNDDGRITPFRHITEFIEEILNVRSSSVSLKDGLTGKTFVVPIEKLWAALRRELVFIYPYAREEAIHMSPESITREAKSSFKFTLDEKLEE